MSKHSKNNTSGSVFTHAYRARLKNVYGYIHTRIGEDSKKKFEDCTICHCKMIEPMCCDHGHTFCRSCVIEFLVKQKKKLGEQEKYVERQKEQEKSKTKLKYTQKEVEILYKFYKYDNFLSVTYRNGLLSTNNLANDKKYQNEQKIDLKSIKPTGKYHDDKEKDKFTKSSFWTIENTPYVSVKAEEKQYKHVECPGSGTKHKLTLKKLRNLKMYYIDNIFCCWVCKKYIGKQKIGCYKCGHIICEGCKSYRCEVCEYQDKWLAVEGNASAFSSRNDVEVKTYTHAFLT